MSQRSMHTHEFVVFSFRAEVGRAQQRELMASVDPFVASQPGFVARHAYFSEELGRWIDHVVWRDAESAKAAAALAMKDPSMAPLMSRIDEATVSFGHYEAMR